MKARIPPVSLCTWLLCACCAVSAAMVFAGGDPDTGGGETVACGTDPGDGISKVVLTTSLGTIVVEVFPNAAPGTVARWMRLVEGPAPEAVAGPGPDALPPGGYYDGLVFSYTKPHVEIVTSARAPDAAAPPFEVELDAVSLGLNDDVIENYAEAMRVLQWDLIRAHGKMGKGDDRPPLLKKWIDRWRETKSAEFLIGESRQRINEAQGYVYAPGLRSRPVTAGAVALKPLSPTRASARLSIALADMPQRTGKWMVIGRVVEGLDVAEKISVRTLKGQGTPQAKQFQPLEPVVITRVETRAEARRTAASPPDEEQTSQD